jgi:hypothetical protein
LKICFCFWYFSWIFLAVLWEKIKQV